MARPRIFISSTFYDLRHIRASLNRFIEQLGYESVLSEEGRIAYDPDLALDESCYRDASTCDVFVLIIGGRHGSAASGQERREAEESLHDYISVTQREFESAIENDILTYILVDRDVFAEYRTYLKNKQNADVSYAHVDSVNVFSFLEKVLARQKNNPVHQFYKYADIEEWLKEQWAGLFRDFISRRSNNRQISALSDRVDQLASINSALQNYLEKIVSLVSADQTEAERIISKTNETIDTTKRINSFLKSELPSELVDLFGIERNDVVATYMEATSMEDLARRTAKLMDNDPDLIAEVWKGRISTQNFANAARRILHLQEFDYIPGSDL